MLSAILQRALTSRQRNYGFTLIEDVDFLALWLKEELVATFSATGATVLAVQEAADRRMEQDLHLFSFERVS